MPTSAAINRRAQNRVATALASLASSLKNTCSFRFIPPPERVRRPTSFSLNLRAKP